MNGKRNLRLMMSLLVAIEAETSIKWNENHERRLGGVDKIDPEVVQLHYQLLLEEKFVIGHVDPKADPVKVFVSRMTWKGYDYLDELRARGILPLGAGY